MAHITKSYEVSFREHGYMGFPKDIAEDKWDGYSRICLDGLRGCFHIPKDQNVVELVVSTKKPKGDNYIVLCFSHGLYWDTYRTMNTEHQHELTYVTTTYAMRTFKAKTLYVWAY